MYLQSNIYNWILRKNWKGLNTLEDIIAAYHPLFKEKYLHPFEKNPKENILIELRSKERFFIPNIKIEIQTNKGLERFKLIDISANGLSFMINNGLNFFNQYHSHNIHLTLDDKKIIIKAKYRHCTLISSKKPYYKYGVEFQNGHEELKQLIEDYENK